MEKPHWMYHGCLSSAKLPFTEVMRLLHLAHARAGLLHLWCTDRVWAGPPRGMMAKPPTLLAFFGVLPMSCKQEGKVVRGFVFRCVTFPTPTKAVSFAAWLEYCLCKTCKRSFTLGNSQSDETPSHTCEEGVKPKKRIFNLDLLNCYIFLR